MLDYIIGIALPLIMAIAALNMRIIYKQFRELKFLRLFVVSMDYALEKSLMNGYADYRDEKLDFLLKKEKYVEKSFNIKQ